MKIKEFTGCTAFAFTFDGISECDLTEKRRLEIINYLFEKMREGLTDGTVTLQTLVKCFQYDDYGSEDSPCEQCGDTVSWTEWDI
jgi:hypothetical protein